jgi:carbamoyltransferase
MLSEGHVFAWFQGRPEFGPRVLGNRSIVSDPRKAEMKDKLNKRVKHRQAFRPFAPAVLAERANEILKAVKNPRSCYWSNAFARNGEIKSRQSCT